MTSIVITRQSGRPSTPSRLLTIAEAAEALGISRSSVYRPFDAGNLHDPKSARPAGATSTEIERFIAARPKPRTSSAADLPQHISRWLKVASYHPHIKRIEFAQHHRSFPAGFS